jgi:hypothetical protein
MMLHVQMKEMKATAQVTALRQQLAQMEEAAAVQHQKQEQLEAALAEGQAQMAQQAMSTRAASDAFDARVQQMERDALMLQQQAAELKVLLETTTSDRDQLQGALQGTLDFYQAACQQRDQAISERDAALSERDQAKAAEKLLQGLVEAMAVESAEQRQQLEQWAEHEAARAELEQQQRARLLVSEFPDVPLENQADLIIMNELGRGAFGAVKRVQSKERAVKHFIVSDAAMEAQASLPAFLSQAPHLPFHHSLPLVCPVPFSLPHCSPALTPALLTVRRPA